MADRQMIVGPNGYAVVYPPIQCACGRMAAFLINRNGKTRCSECDTRNLRAAPTKEEA